MTKKIKKEWGCPLTKNRSNWCHGRCVPDLDNLGQCGRIAAHGLKGKTQEAIMKYKGRYKIGMEVKALCTITEGGGDYNDNPDYHATDFLKSARYVHAEKDDLGEIVYVDTDGCPTVRFFRKGTATVVGDHEIEIRNAHN